MNEDATLTAPVLPLDPSHKDRRTGLIVFGVFQILLGLLCLGMAALIPVSVSMIAKADADPMTLRMMVPGLLMYLLWGVWGVMFFG